ncbi:MAG: M48 family metalloprotease [Actinomycetota bacterium]|nr:M48 family metalloprotease [Actinomycetota bacterium]
MPRSLRLPAMLVAVVVVAEAGVLLLRPRESGPQPKAVLPTAYFSTAEIDRAEAFRSRQLALYGLRLAIEVGVLVALVRRPPKRLTGATRRPVVLGAVAGAGISLALGAATLPVRVIAREASKDVGLVTQGWADYAADVVKGELVGAAMAGVGGALVVVVIRRFGRRWWIAGSAVIVGYGIVLTYLAPIVIEPLFNEFKPLPRGDLRSDVLSLASRAGVEVGEVYEVDASRRTTASNAYVAGLGQTKRVVLYDNLLRDFKPAEVRLIVAHELAHVRYRDVPQGLLYLALVAPMAMFATALAAERLTPRRAATPAASLPAIALSAMVLTVSVGFISNQLSRAVEKRADFYALGLVPEPDVMIAMQQRLVRSNVSDPDPPALVRLLLATHPPAIERIGMAEALRD